MGIFDFFKKKKPVEIEKEKIYFDEITNWIEKKANENSTYEKEIFVQIKDKTDAFVNQAEDKIKILQAVDISEKKEQDKVKSVVNDSRDSYIESVESLLEKLESLERKSLKRFTKDVNKVFFNFNKTSHKNYERATILIGKEMASLRESLRIFSRDLVKIFDENKTLLDTQKTLFSIEQKLNHLEKIDKTIIEIDENLNTIEKEITEKQKHKKKILYDIEQIKESKSYLDNIEKKRRIKIIEEELEKDIFDLKQFIDFKALASFFHINPEQMEVVKEYREDFVLNFKKDNGQGILRLLDEIKMNSETIVGKVNEINNKNEEIVKNKREIIKDQTVDLYSENEKIILEIKNLEKEEQVKKDKRENLDKDIIGYIELIKRELDKLDVEMVEDHNPSQATPSESPSNL